MLRLKQNRFDTGDGGRKQANSVILPSFRQEGKLMRVFICALLLWMQPLTASAERLVYSGVFNEPPETIVKQVRPMLSYLEGKLGVTIDIDYIADYEEVLAKFRRGKIDLAFLGPLPYMTLKAEYPPATPVVGFLEPSGAATYTCALVAPADGLVRVEDLSGRRLALTQPLSTCGYLVTGELLRRAGVDPELTRYRYLGRHDQVALAITRGEFEAGGMKSSIAAKYRHLGLAVLAESGPLPAHVLVANSRTVAAHRIESLRTILSALQPLTRPADAAIVQSWGANFKYGAVPARDADFDPVRNLGNFLAIPEKGNF
jgi:phosphonate transport system substrate-binding protein